ncbi:MAG TPA: MFS transporter [Candidatus Scatomorpha merdigallinarum]|nr:MFS transporter [Candidatus Scatomorpha merdigallinarum]
MKERKFSYHWVIVICCFIMLAASTGGTTNSSTVISPAMIEALGYSSAQVQTINMVATFGTMICGMFIGKTMSKYGIRRVMTIFAIMMTGGFALRGACTEMWQFCISSAIYGLGMGGTATVPAGILVNNWFSIETKGTMSGIAFTGSVVGGMIFTQVARALIATYDWRMTHYIIAAICAALLLPISLFVVKERPQDVGLRPYGSESAAPATAAPTVDTGISAKKFYKTGSFWLLSIAAFLIGFINMGIQRNFAICLQQEHGHSAAFAANVFSAVMAIQIVGKLLLGRIYDKKGVKFGTIYNMLLVIFTVILAVMSDNSAMAWGFGLVFGMLGSMTTVTPPYLTALIVGRRNYSQIFGIVNVFANIGVATGSVAAASVFDATGSYTGAWIGFAVLGVVCAIATVLATRHAAEYRTMMD